MTFATLSVLINAATALLVIVAIAKDRAHYNTLSWLIDGQEEEVLRLSDLVAELELKLEEVGSMDMDEVDRRIDLIKEEIDERVDNAVDNKTSDLESRIDDLESTANDNDELKSQVEVLETKIDKIRAAFSCLAADLED